MAFLNKLVYCIAITSVAIALPTERSQSYQEEETEDSYNSKSYTDESKYEAFALPTNLQLPKTDSSPVSFYGSDLTPVIKASQYNTQQDYFHVPIPSQELVAPSEKSWNPENDPKFFYEIPASITQQNVPTNHYPKKFNQELHTKSKPYSSKPKQAIVLRPINEKQFIIKQKALNKVYDNLAKTENQKELQVQQSHTQPRFSHSDFTKPFETERVAPQRGFTKYTNTDLTAAFGSLPVIHSSASSSSSSPPRTERQEFHMTGHDGPHSYKWGFDTGKGHNRQFRYEERDKEGIVKGHFGFYDKHGKLQMVNYDAHPHDGYHADGNFGKF